VLSEIVNIVGQLEEIVGTLGVPITTGGSRDDYLCAVSRGLVQFVCARSGRGVYRSLTAEKIHIHPGSVMFREDPQYLVAGEIVRTSRMYARSVSPLRKAWLARISPVLAESLLGGAPYEGAAAKERRRDFTSQIRLGSGVFPIRVVKGGRKVVELQWEKLKPLLRELEPGTLPPFRDLRGTILWQGREICTDMKLGAILAAAPHIHPEQGAWEDWPQGKTFPFSAEARTLAGLLPRLLCLCPLKPGSDRLGFLALHSDNRGNYWFRVEKSLVTARLESLASLESMVDEPGELLDPAERETVSKLYRELSDLLEQ
jgi:ATP-dependent helicase HrpA